MNFSKIQKNLEGFLDKSTHVVIKIGTGVLNPHIETTDFTFFEKLSAEIKYLQEIGKKVLIVSSGAVGFGKKIRRKKVPSEHLGNSIVDKQAYAALGQSFLIDTYRQYLDKVGLDAAQILLSMSDFKSRTHFQNMKRAIDQLLAWESVPVINENDTVDIDEKFGDNDTLSAMIAGMYQQSLLIILTTIDGFYSNDKKVDLLQNIDSSDLKSAGGAAPGGIGGMKTKLFAGKKIIQSGQVMNISSGRDPAIIKQILKGERIGTWFVPSSLEPVGAKKRWLLHYRFSLGELFIDEGAEKALMHAGASLLTVGVKNFYGKFAKGDVVKITGISGEQLAMGQVAFSSDQLREVLDSREHQKGLEIVHRDNLALLK